MTKNQELLQTLKTANVLKRIFQFKVKSYESTITMPPDNDFTRLLRKMKSEQEAEIGLIQDLIDFIKSEHKPKCRHPKKMQDTDPNGTVYCMKCGEDV